MRTLIRQSPNWEKAIMVLQFILLSTAFQSIVGGLWEPLRLGAYLMVMPFVVVNYNYEKVIYTITRNPFIITLLGLAAVSVIWSDSTKTTIIRGIALFMTTLVAGYLVSQYTFDEIIQMVAIAMIIMAITSIIWVFLEGQSSIWRGVFPQKNTTGRVMALGTMIFLGLPIKRPRDQIFRVLGYLFCFVFVVRSGSGTALFITMAISSLFIAFRVFWLSVPSIIAIFTALFTPVVFTIYTVTTIDINEFLYSIGRDPTLTGRTNLWANVEYAISLRPVLGYGYSGFWRNWNGVFGTLWTRRDNWITGSAHNSYLEILVQLGLVGLVLFLAASAFFYVYAFKYARKHRTNTGLMPLLLIALLTILSFSESFPLYMNIFWMLYMAFGFHIASAAIPTNELARQEHIAEDINDIHFRLPEAPSLPQKAYT